MLKKKGAIVTATDINQVALDALTETSTKNRLQLNIINSNLFDNILQEYFDYIIINPPYYPKKPKNNKEAAWFCGENFEYFENLFNQLSNRFHDKNIFMILSEDCDLNRISYIAETNNLKLNCIYEKKTFSEENFIFKILSSKNKFV